MIVEDMAWLEDEKPKKAVEKPVRIVEDVLTVDKREAWRKAVKERVESWREKLQGPPDEFLDFVLARGRRIDVKIRREKDGTLVIEGNE